MAGDEGGGRRVWPPSGAPGEGEAGFLKEGGDGGETLGVTGSEDEGKARVGGEEVRPGSEEGGLFAIEGAAGDDEAEAGGALAELACGGGFFNRADVEFEVAGDGDAGGLAADGYQTGGIGLALRENAGDAAEEGTPEDAKGAVAGPGTVRDAGVDDGDGNLAAGAGADEVGPEFGFSEDEQLGAEGAQPGADGPGEIEGAVEDAFRAEALLGEFLTGSGGGGDDDIVAGECGLEGADEAGDGEDFPDGDGMDPEDGVGLAEAREEGAADEAEAFKKAEAIFVSGGHLEEPPGSAEDEDQEEREVVDEQNHA